MNSFKNNFQHPKGFALITCMVIMSLLLVVGLASISLSSSESKITRHSKAQFEAQANARLALITAISQLQIYSGTDQTTTTRADLLDTRNTPDHTPDADIPNPYFTLAFQTSPLEINAGHGLFPRQANHLPAVLVSGNENFNLLDPNLNDYPEGYTTQLTNLDPATSITLLSTQSSNNNDQDKVKAPLVPLANQKGAYAYWIGDLGIKAKINLQDPNRSANQSLTSTGNNTSNNFLSLLSPARLGIENAGNTTSNSDDFLEPISTDPEHTSKLHSQNTVAILGSKQQVAIQQHTHDFTTHSLSVLSDSQNGGLKKNLTAAVNLPDSDFIDLVTHGGSESSQPSPTFLFKNYSFPAEIDQLDYRHFPGNSWEVFRSHIRRPEFEPALTGPSVSLPALFSNNAIPQYWEQALPTTNNNLKSRLVRRTPILTRFQVGVDYSVGYNGIVTESDGTQWHDFSLRQHFIPFVSYWNPYNVELTVAEEQTFAYYANRDYGTGSMNTNMTAYPASTDPFKIFALPTQRPTAENPDDPPPPYIPEWIDASGSSLSYIYPLRKNGSGITNISFKVPSFTIPAGKSKIFALNGANKEYTVGQSFLLEPVTKSADFTGYSGYNKNATIRVRATTQNSANWQSLIPELRVTRFPSGPGYTRVTASNCASFQRTNWDVHSVIAKSNIRFVPTTITDDDTLPQSDANGVESPKFAATLIRKSPDISHYFPDSDTTWDATTNGIDTNSYLAPWSILYNQTASRHGAYGAAPGSPRSFASPPLYIAGTIVGKNSYELISPEITENAEPYTGYNDTSSGGSTSSILYPLQRAETPVLSIGQLRHLNTSKWISNYTYGFDFSSSTDAVQPTNAIANSFASPHIPLNRTSSIIKDNTSYSRNNGIATQYDTSYRYNDALWDRFFLTGNRPGEITDPKDILTKIPNQSLKPLPAINIDTFNDPHKSASKLMLDGGFNINSTSVEAWKTLLSATLGLRTSSADSQDPDLTPFPRLTYTDASPITSPPTNPADKNLYDGSTYRALTKPEITKLAEEIVKQNKLRGPYPTLSQWINRSLDPSQLYRAKHLNLPLTADQVSYEGPLQAAINHSGINGAFNTSNANYPPELAVNSETNTADYEKGLINPKTLKYHSGYGAPATLTQADILARIGHLLTARSDTFIIRAYGESRDENGNVTARAWCEATVQRQPQYLNPADAPETPPNKWTLTPSTGIPNQGTWTPNPELSQTSQKYGRRYTLTSFRWLSPDEID